MPTGDHPRPPTVTPPTVDNRQGISSDSPPMAVCGVPELSGLQAVDSGCAPSGTWTSPPGAPSGQRPADPRRRRHAGRQAWWRRCRRWSRRPGSEGAAAGRAAGALLVGAADGGAPSRRPFFGPVEQVPVEQAGGRIAAETLRVPGPRPGAGAGGSRSTPRWSPPGDGGGRACSSRTRPTRRCAPCGSSPGDGQGAMPPCTQRRKTSTRSAGHAPSHGMVPS
jgi:hypothetical protein